jgi:hypothetical protein
MVKALVKTVLLDCPGPLRGLLASCPGIDGLAGGGVSHPAPDVQAPLLSLPLLLGTDSLDKIPAPVSYLFVDQLLREQWQEKVPQGPGLRVGICWQGNPLYSGDRFRSVALEVFRPLAAVPGVRLFSMQKGAGSEQLPALQEELGIIDLGCHIGGDFRDTAAAIMNLDLVITVDSSVAHLAGALGVPAWIVLPANPDWRWGFDRSDSPWYPRARLFRQKAWGDWPDVFARVALALREEARRPLLRRARVPLDLADLIERAVIEKQSGRPADSTALLLHSGHLDRPEVALLSSRLESAHRALAQFHLDMKSSGTHPNGADHAVELLQRYASASEQRTTALAHFSAWLSGANATEASLPSS